MRTIAILVAVLLIAGTANATNFNARARNRQFNRGFNAGQRQAAKDFNRGFNAGLRANAHGFNAGAGFCR